MKLRFVVGCMAVVAALVALPVRAQDQQEKKPVLSMSHLSDKQIAVYKAVLREWMSHEMPTVNLAALTKLAEPDGMQGYKDCAKGLEIEKPSEMIHRFMQADAARMAPDGAITLLEPRRGNEQVHENDPEQGMRRGQSIEDAVKNGFAHGLFSFTEIIFDKAHQHAIVSYGFV
jgi:hypothetical protein